jgi:ATP-dependent helicase HrpB
MTFKPGSTTPPLMPLPFDASWGRIELELRAHRNLVLVAEPGAGKTTRFPAMLIASDIVQNRVAVLEPRRLAARAAASRIASERGWPMKTMVGYSVRFDHQLTESTRLAFFTEGLFLKRLAQNPTLQGVDCVVLDEFHERSRFTDLAIAALKELQLLERPDLRIVVMSATINAKEISNYLSIDELPAPIVDVAGRTFPIDVRHSSEPLTLATSREWTERMVKQIKSVALGPNDRKGDILVFFPGVGEIRRTRESLEIDATLARTFQILELHGSLSLEEQNRVLSPTSGDSRPRIVLATNIAETSLTIDGVGTVIDSGLARVARADRLGFSQLHLERISFASARQRSGRAGRQSDGLCYRMWSRLDENSFQDFDEAELNRIDLTDSLLDLYSLGVSDPRNFDWFERPDETRLKQAMALLQQLGALDSAMRLTALGTEMHRTGLPARTARMMVAARRSEISGVSKGEAETLAAILTGLLNEKDFLLDASRAADSAGHECDLSLRAALLIQRQPSARIDRASLKTLQRVIDSLLSRDACSIDEAISRWNEKAIAALLIKGFPDRVARRRKPKAAQARMVGGKGVELHSSSSVRESEFFFALKGDAGTSRTSSDPMTTMASQISKDWLLEFAPTEITKRIGLVFDNESLTVFSERALMFRDLPLESGARDKANPDEAFEMLNAEAKARQDLLLKIAPLQSLDQRVRFLRRQTKTDDFLSEAEADAALEKALEEKLYGQTSLRSIFSDEGADALAETWERHLSNINATVSRSLRETAPSHFSAPTGNRFRITYPEHQSPFLEVRLQELFGLSIHPKVAGVPLTFHLLGPNYRPVQVTADLPGFWRGSYFEVRKELRARYPKHSWPENPLEAAPEAKGHRRR